MTEEELKAIKNYKMFEEAIKQTISKGDRELYIDNLEAALRDTRILLSLIEKQQKELENSVSKDKIRDKIKELEREKRILEDNKMKDKMVYTPYQIVNAEILRLQELLEED